MMNSILAALLLAATAKAIAIPESNGNDSRGLTNHLPQIESPARLQGNGVLRIPLHRTSRMSSNDRKRQLFDPLRNDISGYSIQLSIGTYVGTPPLIMEVQIDTGSSELWVDPDCAVAFDPTGCVANGVYTPSNSITSQNINMSFSITYGIGSAAGTYFTDNVGVGGVVVKNQQFGVATTSQDMVEGILGIGPGIGLDTNYLNFIDQLAAQGLTQSRAFSLDLGSIDDSEGSVIFGGIDTMKYTGVLEKRPIIPFQQSPDKFPRYWINMTSVRIITPGSSESILVSEPNTNQAIFPDSGSTLSQLPPQLFNSMLAFFPTAVNDSNAWTVPCDLKAQDGTIDFGFGNTTIHVSYHEFIWFDGVQCWFGAQPNDQFFLLGDTFIRSTYVVYDQDNQNVFLAQAANCGSNIVPISAGVDAVPSIIGGCPTSSTASSTRQSTATSSSWSVTSSASVVTSLTISSSITISSLLLLSPTSANVQVGSMNSTVSSMSTSTTPNTSNSPSTSSPTSLSTSSSQTTSTTSSPSSSNIFSSLGDQTSSTYISTSSNPQLPSANSTAILPSQSVSTTTSLSFSSSQFSNTSSGASSLSQMITPGGSSTPTSSSTSSRIFVSAVASTLSPSNNTPSFLLSLTSSSNSSLSTSLKYSNSSSTTSSTTTTISPTASAVPWAVNTNGQNYTYLGCSSDGLDRALTATSMNNDSVSAETCSQFCEGYQFFGLEFGSWCFCGDIVENGNLPISSNNCHYVCHGAPLELCGGVYALDIYQDEAFITSSTTTKSTSTTSSNPFLLSASTSSSSKLPSTNSSTAVAPINTATSSSSLLSSSMGNIPPTGIASLTCTARIVTIVITSVFTAVVMPCSMSGTCTSIEQDLT